MHPLLSVQSLSKRYGDTVAVDGLDLKLRPGEILGLLGPNGAGKTTTVECILGLRQADAGSIHIDGIDALSQPSKVKPLIGAQLQSTRLHEQLTPLEALKLFAAFYPKAASPKELLGRFSLTDKAHSPYDQLSGGQRQRLALALAFVNRPKLLILDEPTVGLDPGARRELFYLIQSLRTDGTAVLLCTHQLDEAQHHCDQLILIDQGKRLASGTPSELIAQSSAQNRVHFSLKDTASEALRASIAELGSLQGNNTRYSLTTSTPSQTVAALTALLHKDQQELQELRIDGPCLEDAYHELTGRSWPSTEPEEVRK